MREKINKIMHILVHNSFLVTVIVIGLVHAALLGITWYADVTPLANFNILSVVVYSFCVVLCKNGHYLPVYVSLFLEVVIYSAISVYYIGWGCGSYFFLFSIVPIVIYFGCFFLKGSNRRIIVLMLILIFTMFVVLYVIYGKQTPKYSVNDTIREILFTFSAFAMFFAVVFYNAIYIYSSEDEKSSLEEKNVRLSYILNGIYTQEKLEVSEEELLKDKQKMLDSNPERKDDVEKYFKENKENILAALKEDKIFKFLIDNAKITETETDMPVK